MSIGAAILVSTILVLAYHFFLIPVRDNPKLRKVLLWVLGSAFIVLVAFLIWANS